MIRKLMKGHAIQKRRDKIIYPVLVEYKHDEIRAHIIIREDGYDVLSYAGKPLANCTDIVRPLVDAARALGYTELDCGVEVNGNYNDSFRWCRSTNGVPKDLKGTRIIVYLYDLPDLSTTEYVKRRHRMADLLRNIFEAVGRLHFIACEATVSFYMPTVTHVLKTSEHLDSVLDDVFTAAVQTGYEGLMLKTAHGMYERTRSKYIIKVKPEEDADGLIIGMTEAVSEDGVPLGRAGSLEVRLEDGSIANPGGMEHATATKLWDNREQYIGKQWVQFTYMERDRQGGYRHPRIGKEAKFGRLREEK